MCYWERLLIIYHVLILRTLRILRPEADIQSNYSKMQDHKFIIWLNILTLTEASRVYRRARVRF